MRAKLTYANVVATLALIIAVAGGSAAVALSIGKNSVKASSIKAGNVTARELAGVRVVRATAARVHIGRRTLREERATAERRRHHQQFER